MEYECIYEISKFQLPIEFIGCFVMALIAIVLAINYIIEIIHNEKKVRNFIFVVLLVIMAIVAIYLGINSLKYGGGEKCELSRLYYSGQYEVVEGNVEKLITDELSQEYYVEDILFSLSRTDETIWDIKNNGQYVRISYIPPTEENAYEYPEIVKLEIAQDKK